MNISGWLGRRKAYRQYMNDEIGTLELSDDEKIYIKKRLGRQLRITRKPYVCLHEKWAKLLGIIQEGRIGS